MFKNVASQKIEVYAFDSTTGAPKTGDAANITAYVAKDFGAVTVLGDTTATEADATNAKGLYVFDLTQAETNADHLQFSGKSSTANIYIVPRWIETFPNRFTTTVIDAAGLVDANAVKLGPTGAGTAQTARDIGASVLLSSGTGTGQLSFTSGILKVDLDTIKTNPVVNAGTITFPTGATLASTTNITAGTIATVTNLTNAPTAGDLTATMKTSVTTAATAATPTIAGTQTFNNTGTWTGNIVGTLSTLTTYTGNTPQTGDSYARVGAPVGASISADIAAVKTDSAAVKVQTDKLTFTVANQIDANVLDWKSATAPAMTGDAFARLGAPAGASVSADVAAVKVDTAAVKVQTDKLTFTVANKIDANVLNLNGDATAAANIAKTTLAIGRCTASGVPTTTSIPTSACTPAGAAADQFKGRIITFDANTTTTALRGQATDITASSNSATPTFTVTALTTAPVSGDVFSIT